LTPFSSELRAAGEGIWARQHSHPFVTGIADGTLPEAAFRFYIRQDYLYLIEYGRLFALGVVRAPRLEWMRRFAALAQAILETEMELHRAYAAGWGIDAAQLEAERPAPATAAYTDFLLRTAALGDFSELAAALLPCMWGYAEIGERLGRGSRPPDPRYAEWIDMYAGEEFQRLAAWSRELVDASAAEVSGHGHDRMVRAFLASSEHELAFWESAWRQRAASA
jgi:thiaminase/transcriptional activator TenA